MMIIIDGTVSRQNATDQPVRCRGCGRMFYARYENRVTVRCPYCGKLH